MKLDSGQMLNKRTMIYYYQDNMHTAASNKTHKKIINLSNLLGPRNHPLQRTDDHENPPNAT